MHCRITAQWHLLCVSESESIGKEWLSIIRFTVPCGTVSTVETQTSGILKVATTNLQLCQFSGFWMGSNITGRLVPRSSCWVMPSQLQRLKSRVGTCQCEETWNTIQPWQDGVPATAKYYQPCHNGWWSGRNGWNTAQERQWSSRSHGTGHEDHRSPEEWRCKPHDPGGGPMRRPEGCTQPC